MGWGGGGNWSLSAIVKSMGRDTEYVVCKRGVDEPDRAHEEMAEPRMEETRAPQWLLATGPPTRSDYPSQATV